MSDLELKTGGALERREGDDLRLAYAELTAARTHHAAFLLEREAREAALGRKSHHVQGALEAAKAFLAGAGEGEAAASLPVPAEDFRAELQQGREAFEAWAREETGRLEAAIEAASAEVTARVERWLEHFRPHLRLEVAAIGKERSVVHLPTPRGDEAVLLCALLTGKPPLTYDFLLDDAVDHLGQPSALAAAGAGIDLSALREGSADDEDAIAHGSEATLLPIRRHLPLTDPILGWPRFRLMLRGPVLELESREADTGYTHLLPAAHAERFTGYLVALQAKGKLEVAVDLG
ncbi:MAG: hypothetical protein P1V51_08250 [Deltaproteobacteria bacterium]|nr:hypothetical protein [Deltaproteobacteria bacterium]